MIGENTDRKRKKKKQKKKQPFYTFLQSHTNKNRVWILVNFKAR